MKLIVGLGNPGAKYKNTRHNLGFMVVDGFAKSEGLAWRYNQDLLCYYFKSSDFILIKPSTYMNKSGESVRLVSNFYKIEPKDILAVHDDLDLEFGKIRFVFDSSSAGHKGVESLIESLGGYEFGRLRVGIARPPDGVDPEKYVLEEFTPKEQQELPSLISRSLEAVKSYIEFGIEAAMNRYN
ncbi:aminoacyl-tRNA hydrolase [Candidatus Curtissbacteria bacterium RIFCSPHIGHO2_12_41_11]|uniref:Peptidyl-tRNA hydrolase n=2 Tax=Candidatus Curtissiibacteriota TaxID=1752717 RepID=A0A1F5HPK3_9BACT|nr:MAG: aminoacyl-tRNA hydrolase [Candidatus Curtissbacteria bacterium RIFCSPHIGHO2_02_39_8]OGD98231.1 MAG: aminoacyl-tRNA hydrolase [Candidatus Curtissbacteria bacterium RIFCSPHIGHO2_12_41_11]OGE06012.1 MAG: aminoacyl-tRNA hydrolase [Candidatus Curtissbacteria bacterium RIFCSPLOWO2_02_41_11]